MFIFDNTLNDTTIHNIINFRIDDITDRLNNEITRLTQLNNVANNEVVALNRQIERLLNRPNRENRQNPYMDCVGSACNISGGNNNYYDKYMKYKTKYLTKN